jgi:RNA polymerase sigma-70 factor (ECF subfamily)
MHYGRTLGEQIPSHVEYTSTMLTQEEMKLAVDVKQLEDAKLMQRIAQGREDALGELYDRYHRLVFSIALRVIGNRASAEEIMLDVFTSVWIKGHTYRADKAQVNTWLARLARNRAIDVLRREEVRPLRHSVDWADVSQMSADGRSPEAATQLALRRQQVRSAINELPPEQQEALALAYFQGYTHREIAEVLEQPLGTVKTRIRSGMQTLRGLLMR